MHQNKKHIGKQKNNEINKKPKTLSLEKCYYWINKLSKWHLCKSQVKPSCNLSVATNHNNSQLQVSVWNNTVLLLWQQHNRASLSDVQMLILYLSYFITTVIANLTKIETTLISLINMGPTLTDFEKFQQTQNKNPTSTFIDFLDFSTLHSSFIRVMY